MKQTTKQQPPSAVNELAIALAKILLPRIKNHIDEKFFVFEVKINKAIKNNFSLLKEQMQKQVTTLPRNKLNKNIFGEEDEELMDEDVEGYANKLGNQLGLIGEEEDEEEEMEEVDQRLFLPKNKKTLNQAIQNGHTGIKKINEDRQNRIVNKVKKNLGIEDNVLDLIMSAEEPQDPSSRYAEPAINEQAIGSVDVADIVNNKIDENEIIDPLQINYSKLVEKMDEMRK